MTATNGPAAPSPDSPQSNETPGVEAGRMPREVAQPAGTWAGARAWARSRTPARIFADRAGGSCGTREYLELRADHAAALDAVQSSLQSPAEFPREFVTSWRLFVGSTRAASRREYLLRPDLGRLLDERTRDVLAAEYPRGVDLQMAIGDGLSVTAVWRHAPQLVTRLADQCAKLGWSFGRPFALQHCRVGVLNEIGTLLDPQVVVLLIGERPGLATDESMSAYLAYRPRPGHTDADRNLVSNIHSRGISLEDAARRIIDLALLFRSRRISGVSIKETGELPA